MFDDYKAKLRTLGFVAREHKTKKIRVRNEDTGVTAGIQVEHKDGRVDAHVTPPPSHLRSTVERPQ